MKKKQKKLYWIFLNDTDISIKLSIEDFSRIAKVKIPMKFPVEKINMELVSDEIT